MTAAAIYARVSSARQAKDETIGSQLAAPFGYWNSLGVFVAMGMLLALSIALVLW